MNRFLGKILLFSIFPIFTLIGIFRIENGFSDPFYQRFTTPKQGSLIIGNSRAAQGLIPNILNAELDLLISEKIYNYCFTVYNSPFGPIYLESIKRKLHPNTKNGLFIVTVDPWSISSNSEFPNDENHFVEMNYFLSRVKNVSINPNLEYMFFGYDKSFYEILLLRLNPQNFKLHDDGWFFAEDNRNFKSDSTRKSRMVEFYKGLADSVMISRTRIDYLEKTVEFLQTKGKVIFVRMPVEEEILKIDNELIPDFNLVMNDISIKYNVKYIDANEWHLNLEFKDGIHLYSDSAEGFTRRFAKELKAINF